MIKCNITMPIVLMLFSSYCITLKHNVTLFRANSKLDSLVGRHSCTSADVILAGKENSAKHHTTEEVMVILACRIVDLTLLRVVSKHTNSFLDKIIVIQNHVLLTATAYACSKLHWYKFFFYVCAIKLARLPLG
jgi:hypothetical protein